MHDAVLPLFKVLRLHFGSSCTRYSRTTHKLTEHGSQSQSARSTVHLSTLRGHMEASSSDVRHYLYPILNDPKSPQRGNPPDTISAMIGLPLMQTSNS